MENVLSVVVRHNPGIGGYDVVKEWLNCESRCPRACRLSVPGTCASMDTEIRQHPSRTCRPIGEATSTCELCFPLSFTEEIALSSETSLWCYKQISNVARGSVFFGQPRCEDCPMFEVGHAWVVSDFPSQVPASLRLYGATVQDARCSWSGGPDASHSDCNGAKN